VACWGGLEVRRASAPPPASGTLSFVSTRPLTFGDLGGDARRDRGVGVAGGELEPDLVPSFEQQTRGVIDMLPGGWDG